MEIMNAEMIGTFPKPLTPKTIEYADTVNGRLRGFCQRGIYHFLGVQYGECERWRTATPVKPWRGVKNAVQFGNRIFPANGFTPWDSCGVAHEVYPYSEDCLNLNIWTPSLDRGAKKPVMVWIHGGGYGSGSAMEMQAHDGENLARFGDVVVVGINHRLNIFGFLDLSRYGEKYKNSGNAGMSDLVLALRWIHDNIDAFGGDPGNVMIFGQSGGGGKVRALLQIPEADGLFHKAVVMSGAGRKSENGGGPDETDDLSMQVLDILFKMFNTDKIEDLEALTSEELLSASVEAAKRIGVSSVSHMINWHPVANDWYLGDASVVGVREHAKTIPLMVGCTISEMPLMRIYNKHSYSRDQGMEILREAFPGQDVERLAELFTAAWPGKCVTDAIEIAGALGGRQSTIDYADLRAAACSAPTYSYVFAHDFPQEGGRGAWHCADIPVVFHNSALYPKRFSDGLLDGLEDAMCASWVNFARYGDPNNDYLAVKWPAYKTGECATMIFDDVCRVGCDFDRELTGVRDSMKLKIIEKYTGAEQIVN